MMYFYLAFFTAIAVYIVDYVLTLYKRSRPQVHKMIVPRHHQENEPEDVHEIIITSSASDFSILYDDRA